MWLLHSQRNFRERFDEFAFLDSISCRCKLRSLRVRSFSYEEFFLHLFVPKPNLTSSVNENVTGFNIVILKSGTANIQSVPMSHVTCMWRPLQRFFFSSFLLSSQLIFVPIPSKSFVTERWIVGHFIVHKWLIILSYFISYHYDNYYYFSQENRATILEISQRKQNSIYLFLCWQSTMISRSILLITILLW